MTISILATVLRALWFIAENAHASRHKVTPAKDWDRSSLKILMLAALAVPVGVIVGFTDVGHIHTEGNFLGAVGFALMLIGISIRWVAIHTLGRYFTRTVTVMDDHRIIRSGLYRHLRHPSYAGYLLRNLGLGMAYSNWLSIVKLRRRISSVRSRHKASDPNGVLSGSFSGQHNKSLDASGPSGLVIDNLSVT